MAESNDAQVLLLYDRQTDNVHIVGNQPDPDGSPLLYAPNRVPSANLFHIDPGKPAITNFFSKLSEQYRDPAR